MTDPLHHYKIECVVPGSGGLRPTGGSIISEECTWLDEQLRAEHVDAVLVRIHHRGEEIRQDQLEQALIRFRSQDEDLSPQREAVLQDFSAVLVRKLGHTPRVSSRQAVVNEDYEAIDDAPWVFDAASPGNTATSNKPTNTSTNENTAEKDREYLRAVSEASSSET